MNILFAFNFRIVFQAQGYSGIYCLPVMVRTEINVPFIDVVGHSRLAGDGS